MTECTRSHHVLFEAELAELVGRADTELATHLAKCARCRAAAERIVASMGLLDRALSVPGAGPDVDVILARARLEAVPAARRKRRFPRSWVALAAAAAVVTIALWGQREPTLRGVPLASPSGPPPVVDALASDNVAVFETDNPDITVLWFF